MELEGQRVAILATDLFEESELMEPRQALLDTGATPVVIAPHDGELQGLRHSEKGQAIPVDLILDQADPDDFDAVLIPGGALNADKLRVEVKAQEFVRRIDAAGKPLAVICHGPWLLISAGLVDGRHITSYYTIADDLKNAGALWADQEVVIDDVWVSSRQPKDIPAFNREFIALLTAAREG
jgi:protease I